MYDTWLAKRQAANKKISSLASFKSRKMIANGIFMSKLIYLMPVWAGCEDYLTNALQVMQNKVARSVTKRNIFTPVKTLMKECGWLTVRQLMVFHSVVQLHKTVKSQTPEYLYSRVSRQLSLLDQHTVQGRNYYYETRQHASGALRQLPGVEARLDLSQRSWCWRASSAYHIIPASIKTEPKLDEFRRKLKAWVKETVDN